jgi:hypothetical protein
MALPTHSLLESANLKQCPFTVGEILTYNVKIAGLSAGKQVTQVTDKTMLNGRQVYRLVSDSQTDSVFGKLYHFRDWQESYVTTDQLHPLRHVKDLEDRKYRAHVEIDFDIEKGIAQYTKNENGKVFEVPIGIQDELSMVYFLRSKEFNVGQTCVFPVLVKDKPQDVTVTIYRREMMKSEALGRIETLAIRTSHGYLIWLTNDDRRIPVRIEAETRIGKLIGTLEEVDLGKRLR